MYSYIFYFIWSRLHTSTSLTCLVTMQIIIKFPMIFQESAMLHQMIFLLWPMLIEMYQILRAPLMELLR
jgi:hypothetical protein